MSTAAVPLRAHLRDAGEVHLGLGGQHGRVVSGLNDAETRAVVALGSMTARQWGSARIARPPSTRWSSVVQLLGDAAAQVTDPESAMGGVWVAGTGSVADAVRDVLCAMGASVGRPDSPDTTGSADPALAILVAAEHVPAAAGAPWRRDGVPHLPVALGAGRIVIGPLIRPGEGPCLRCMDHYRAVWDPGWADIVSGGPWTDERAAVRHDDVAGLLTPAFAPADLRAVVAGLVGLVARGQRGGRPLPVGVSLTMTSPDPRIQHRLWRANPRCCPDSER